MIKAVHTARKSLRANESDGFDHSPSEHQCKPDDNGQHIVPAAPRHQLLARPTGRGKTPGFVIPLSADAVVLDVKGEPDERKTPKPVSGFSCPACGKPLTRMRGMSKPKQNGLLPIPYDFFCCTGLSRCKTSFETGPDQKPAFPTTQTQKPEV